MAGRSGKTGNGVVTVTTVWADERLYYPVHAEPCTSARGRALARSLTVVKPGGLVIGLAGPPDPGFAKEIGASSLLRGHDFS